MNKYRLVSDCLCAVNTFSAILTCEVNLTVSSRAKPFFPKAHLRQRHVAVAAF